MISRFAAVISVLIIAQSPAVAQLPADCGNLDNAYGPFDYTNPAHFNEKLPIVEDAHFDVGVEQLTGHQGKNNGAAMLTNDIDYTLRAFPNHHRALYAMMRYYLSKVSKGGERLRYSAECYFERARALAPDDAVVHMIEGIYWFRLDRPEAARKSYETALAHAPNSAEIHYNAGLMYLELKEYGLAVKHAKAAYELGYPLQGLKKKLQRLDVWVADEETPEARSASN